MSEQLTVDFIKRPYDSDKRTVSAKIIGRDPMPVGGHEGGKSFLVVRLSRENKSKDVGFVAKKHEALKEDSVMKVIKAYDIARENGLPVPPTTRYFNDGGTPAIIMTDLTEGGKYRVWGYNDHPSTTEIETKNAMNLNEDDLAEVRKLTKKIMEKATEKGLFLEWFYYHIRQDIVSRKVDIVLLDLADDLFNHGRDPKNLKRSNQYGVTEFLKQLALPSTST